MAGGEVGDGQQRLPDVGGAVVEGGWNFGRGGGDLGLMIQDEAGALAAGWAWLQEAGAFALLDAGLAVHADDDAAVSKGVGQSADGGHDLWAPAGEPGDGAGVGRFVL